MVIDGDAMSVEERLSPGAPQPVGDFSGLQGFQFVGAREEADASDDEQRRAALTLELDARAARFHQAVDSSIVLASDGTIRWLGDPVAKLAAGDDLLAPRTILLVDETMSADAQKIVLSRLELWLKATVQRLLGPLFSLRGMQEGSPQLQALGAKIASALGVLEREPVRAVVRGLDQDARAVLRRHGVRFGTYYLYVPSTLRPASRALALQLWCIQKGDEEISTAAQGLIPIASSGRTSAPPDLRVNHEAYRVGGFRSCGDRVVRVDIVERLADMIRAASTLRLMKGSNSGPVAFQVTSQMTSLTGCPGDSFSSVLTALGFESLKVRRSEIIWPAAAAPASPPPETAGLPSPEGDAPCDDAASADLPAPADASQADAPTSEAGEAPQEEAEAPHADEPAPEAEEPPQDEAPAEASHADEPPQDEAPAEALAPPEDADSEKARPEDVAPPESREAPPEDPAPPAADSPSPEVAESTTDAGAAILEPSAEVRTTTVTAADPSKEASETTVDDEVVVWRFARLAPSRSRPPRPARRKFHPQAAQRVPPAAVDASSGAAAPDSEPRADHPVVKGGGDRSAHRGRRHWEATKTQRPPEEKREGRVAPAGRPGGERKPAVDPTSPFAKLMELRSILESESKKRT
jgi:ATP-dependent RNA helicase SUPV3L1/SUV3